MESYEFAGVEYESKDAAIRQAVYSWCEQFGDGPGEQAVYVDQNLQQCAEDMAREWRIPFVEEQGDPSVCRQYLLDFIGEQKIVVRP